MGSHSIPYYLADSLIGSQESMKMDNNKFQSDDSQKWNILPLSMFGDIDEATKGDDEATKGDDEEFQVTFQSENASREDLSPVEKSKDSIKSENEKEKLTTKRSTSPSRVGQYIPIIPDNENFETLRFTPFPTQWNRKEKAAGLEMSPCGLRVTYVGEILPESSDNNSRSVRANYSIPPQCGIFYYEVTVLERIEDNHSRGIIGVGFSKSNVLLNRLPGWEEGSWGYHGDDGNCFSNSGSGKAYGPTYATGDVIGCIFNFIDSTASFTKNGINLGVAFTNIIDDAIKLPTLFPTIGLQTHGETVEVNFGQNKFVFNIESYVADQKDKIWRSIFSSNISFIPQRTDNNFVNMTQDPNSQTVDDMVVIFNVVRQLIISYLIHNGYTETVECFRKCLSLGKSSINPNASDGIEKHDLVTGNCDFNACDGYMHDSCSEVYDDVVISKSICNMILNGDIEEAVKEINECYPGFFEANRNIDFTLQCRRYAEIVLKFNQEMRTKEANGPNDTLINSNENNGSTTFGNRVGSPSEKDYLSSYLRQDSDDALSPSPNECEALSAIIECGQEIYKKFMLEKNPLVRSTLVKVFSLSSYSNAVDNPVAYLLDTSNRKIIADTVHKAILVYKGHLCLSTLEIFYSQTSIILNKLIDNGVYSASLINIHKDCLIDENDL